MLAVMPQLVGTTAHPFKPLDGFLGGHKIGKLRGTRHIANLGAGFGQLLRRGFQSGMGVCYGFSPLWRAI